MLKCEYQNNPCKVKNCKFIKDEYLDPCGLYAFLNTINEELQSYPTERELINSLKADYVKAWNDNARSRAKGKATGTAFEKWIRKQIKGESESGKVSFNFGEFAVDVAIPNSEKSRVILECKKYGDLQHTLALGGLLASSPKNRKLGYVVFDEPDKRELKILKDFKSKYKGRFGYFIIQSNWSRALERLNRFCSIL
jgi:hypothetical protein